MIPGKIIAAFTFIGIIVHEWAHKMACRIFGIRILEVKYFSWIDFGGYVRHEKTNNLFASAVISIAPLIVNLLVAFLLGMIFAFLRYFELEIGWLKFLLLYLGISIGMHAFPSETDMKNISELCKEMKRKKLLIFSKAMEFIFAILRTLSIFWLNVVLALLIFMVPNILLEEAVPSYKARETMKKNSDTIISEFSKLNNLLKKSYPNQSYSSGNWPVSLYSTDKSTGEESATLSPHGAEYVAYIGEKDTKTFWIYTYKVPADECTYLMNQKWPNAIFITSPQNCKSPENEIVVGYR